MRSFEKPQDGQGPDCRARHKMARLAITKNMSQAYTVYKRKGDMKIALSEEEKLRLFGQNLNGCERAESIDHLTIWEDYFKPAYDARAYVYQNDRENFVYDVNWPIDEDTVKGRGSGCRGILVLRMLQARRLPSTGQLPSTQIAR